MSVIDMSEYTISQASQSDEVDDRAHMAIIDKDSLDRQSYIDAVMEFGPDMIAKIYEMSEFVPLAKFKPSDFRVEYEEGYFDAANNQRTKHVFKVYEKDNIIFTSSDLSEIIKIIIDVNLSAQSSAGRDAKKSSIELFEIVRDKIIKGGDYA